MEPFRILLNPHDPKESIYDTPIVPERLGDFPSIFVMAASRNRDRTIRMTTARTTYVLHYLRITAIYKRSSRKLPPEKYDFIIGKSLWEWCSSRDKLLHHPKAAHSWAAVPIQRKECLAIVAIAAVDAEFWPSRLPNARDPHGQTRSRRVPVHGLRPVPAMPGNPFCRADGRGKVLPKDRSAS